jgi:hypothetical protein
VKNEKGNKTKRHREREREREKERKWKVVHTRTSMNTIDGLIVENIRRNDILRDFSHLKSNEFHDHVEEGLLMKESSGDIGRNSGRNLFCDSTVLCVDRSKIV